MTGTSWGSLWRNLYVQVLIGIALGVAVGLMFPEQGAAMKPLGDGFIKLVKMLIAPIVFTTVVVGIAQMGAMKDVGRIGLRALVYFEVVSTLALVIGLVVVNVLQPGGGLHVDPAALDVNAVAAYTAAVAGARRTVDFLLNIIPTTVVDAFARGDILQVLLVLGAVRPGAAAARASASRRSCALHRSAVARAVRDRRHDHAARADRRVRRDGVHGRHVRRRRRCCRSAS